MALTTTIRCLQVQINNAYLQLQHRRWCQRHTVHCHMSHLMRRKTDTLESRWRECHSHRQVHQQGKTEMQKTGSSLFWTLWHTPPVGLSPQLSNTQQLMTSQIAHITESCASHKKTPGQHIWPSNWIIIKDGNSFSKILCKLCSTSQI